MRAYEDYVARWGERGVIHFPIDELGDVVTCGPAPFPPDGLLPIDVPPLFSAAATGDIALFSVLSLESGGDKLLDLVVIGAAPDDPDLLFCLHPSVGAVGLLQVSRAGLEHVNASLALFVEFLYRLSGFLAEGHRGEERGARALALRGELAALDPDAFASADQWWPMAFDLGFSAPTERKPERDLGAVMARVAAVMGRLPAPYGPQQLDPPVGADEDLSDVPPDYAAFLRIADGMVCGASGEVRLSPLRQVRSLGFQASELPGGAARWCAIGDVLQNPVFMERTTGEIWWFSDLDIVWYTDTTLASFAKAADSLAAFIAHMVLGPGYAEHVSSGPDDWLKALAAAPA